MLRKKYRRIIVFHLTKAGLAVRAHENPIRNQKVKTPSMGTPFQPTFFLRKIDGMHFGGPEETART